MNLTTVTSRSAAAIVAAVAGYSSWQHIVEVARRAGEDSSVASVLPLSIDGLILVGTMAMVSDKQNGRAPRLSARVALAFGVVATLAANIASAQPTVTARLVAAVPAVAFLIAVEVLARAGRPLPSVLPTPDRDEFSSTEVVPDPWQMAVPVKGVGSMDTLATEGVASVNAPALTTDEGTAAVATADAKPATPAVTTDDARPPVKRAKPKTLTSEQKVARAAAKMPGALVTEIAARAGVSESTARRYLLAAKVPSPSAPVPAETAPESVNGRVPELSVP